VNTPLPAWPAFEGEPGQKGAHAMPLWGHEFPHMYARQKGDLGIIAPAGWEDTSWHNNTCPSYHHPIAKLELWVNYAEEGERELEGARFMLVETDEDGYPNGDIVCETDDAAVMLAKMNELVVIALSRLK
jgi:hypothetical protein